jgi:hypothetical protein
MGMSAQQMLQNDPEYLARQLAQQEIQRYQNFQNPQLGLAATSGAVLGRGLANLFGGRGFFEVSDPALRRVAETQRVFNEAMSSFDPANPAASYEEMARKFSGLGFGQQAMMAAQEAAKYRQQERTEARQAEELGIRRSELGLRERQVLLDEVNKDPYGSIARALQMPEDSPQRQILLAGASAAVGKQNYDRAIQEAELAKSNAQRELALAQAAKLARGEISETIITEDGRPLTKRGEKLYTMDGRVYEGKVKRLAAPSPYADLLATPPGTTAPAKPTGTPIYNPQTGKIEYKQ